MIVAIDGPAGAGKSTIAREVARRLGFQLIDTGAIYRAVAHRALQQDLDLEDAAALAQIAAALDMSFTFDDDGEHHVWCDGERLDEAIRTEAVSQAASRVSAHPEVRQVLLDLQRELGRARDSVLEGRDIGTVVFPDAEAKIFLTASAHERARRRTEQLQERGEEADYGEVLAEIEARDERDRTRPRGAPLPGWTTPAPSTPPPTKSRRWFRRNPGGGRGGTSVSGAWAERVLRGRSNPSLIRSP